MDSQIRFSSEGNPMPNWPFLNIENLENLHAAALHVLEFTGVRILSNDARKLLRKGGSEIRGDTVLIPPKLVAWALSVTPKSFELYDRDGKKVLTRGDNTFYCCAGGGCPNNLDWRTNKVRPYTLDDAIEAIKVIDMLSPIPETWITGFMSNVQADLLDFYNFSVCFENSIKPMLINAHSTHAFQNIINVLLTEMGTLEEIRKRPVCHTKFNSISPLTYAADTCDLIILASQYDVPISINSWPQLGSTGPVTIAGAVVIAHVEHLAGLVMVQLGREGARFATAGSTPVFDMKKMITSTGAPERVLGHNILIQLGKLLGIPTGASLGTDATDISFQSGVERATLFLCAVLFGADRIHGMGWLDNCNITSLELLVLDCEMAESIGQITKDRNFDKEALAISTIEQVGIGGNFLADDHTLRFFKEEVWYPKLWIRSKEKTLPNEPDQLRVRAQNRIQDLLESHSPPIIDSKTRSALDALFP